MELLDRGDLRDRAPLPWREACELLFDVCSSLALLHSRRLLHRDVSPRNVRCTADGHAKLNDFGAMVPTGSISKLVGTPPFTAPEAVHCTKLDGRTDLFSLGTTLYYALTGDFAYPARNFAELKESWLSEPMPPSASAPDIPAALDRLVMSLISLDPALRPRSAFEVMQHLAAIAAITREEPASVSRAYLVTPMLTARDELLHSFREALSLARRGSGRGLLVSGPPGYGRTRVLEACVLEAKTQGCMVLRIHAAVGSRQDVVHTRSLAEDLLQSAPALALQAARDAGVSEQLFEPAAPPANAAQTKLRGMARAGEQRSELTEALARWFLQVSKQSPLMIVADDAENLDDTSIAVLALLAQRARHYRLIVLAAAPSGGEPSVSTSIDVLSSRCAPMPLRALNLPETEQLLGSVFGDVPNLVLLSTRIQSLAAGSPRETMEIAQHLVDVDVIRYSAAGWEPARAADEHAAAHERARSHRRSHRTARASGAATRRSASAHAHGAVHARRLRAARAPLHPSRLGCRADRAAGKTGHRHLRRPSVRS